uniref:Hemocyte protein-glutamine gamma-glutamyltransferase n=1 Tax=Tachypleus tridentatus TaxID=6853 RepID=TGMH_TACTR|nr:RecName: Full=Hemocyte protein-glutamine gamma-glutamyltransferase; AltName: Full=Hemocyte transglutaminase; Short=TGase [Tachypleus tridentatus]BAA02134.1 transglutaminase [Tachypleus tridentatus]
MYGFGRGNMFRNRSTRYRRRPRYRAENYHSYMLDLLENMNEEFGRNWWGTPESHQPDSGPSSLQVESVELYTRDNAREHNTFMYDLVDGTKPVLILRRGQPFSIAIRFKRNYNPQQDRLKLEIGFGQQPLITKGTLIMLPVSGSDTFTKDKTQWDVRLRQHDGAVITLEIQIPAAVAVGVWKMKIVSQLTSEEQPNVSAVTHECKNKTYILFNPWCKQDSVYMEDEQWRKEYVLSDVGKIFTGSFKQPVGRRWIFGQFTDSVLPACMLILERSGLDYTARSNPIKVVRAISAMVNNIDDEGVLEGRWQEPYDDGVAPWMWTGSSAILEKYLKTRGVPVKYGQCWVFAGVANTVSRALGIPSRTVTNYDSAHDTDDTLTIDKWFDKNGDKIEDATSDSIWNFHVWNDCWMARPDLPTGYGGWQAYDSTPQETSEGVYQTGPASVLAVQRGEIGYMFDSPFVFSEVNADVVHWQEDDSSETGYKKLKIDSYRVGRLLLTKKIGVDDDFGDADAEDITDQYKNKEGTDEERMSVLNAARSSGFNYAFNLPSPEKEDVYFNLLDIEKIKIGQPFHVTVNIENQSSETRRVSAVLSASSIYYTGITGRKIKRENGNFSLQPHQKEVLSIEVTPDEYLEKLVDYAMIKLYAIATVKETQQTWSEEDDFMVEKPNLELEIRGNLQVGTAFVLAISLTNPLKRVLDNCFFTIEAPGVTGAFRVTNRDIQPEEVAVHTVRLIPQKPGPRKIVATFSSRQLIQVVGSKQVEVLD